MELRLALLVLVQLIVLLWFGYKVSKIQTLSWKTLSNESNMGDEELIEYYRIYTSDANKKNQMIIRRHLWISIFFIALFGLLSGLLWGIRLFPAGTDMDISIWTPTSSSGLTAVFVGVYYKLLKKMKIY